MTAAFDEALRAKARERTERLVRGLLRTTGARRAGSLGPLDRDHLAAILDGVQEALQADYAPPRAGR